MHEIQPVRKRPGRGFLGNFSRDLYWRLSSLHDYKSLSRSDLASILKRDGYEISNTTSRHDMVEHSTRAQCGRLHYDRCTRQELLKFVKDKTVKGVSQDSPSEFMVSKLRDWDEKQTFRYLDLPPELRERIAKYYLREFAHEELTFPTPPPLARSCLLLAREILPLFYQTCKFKVAFCWRRQRILGIWEVSRDTSDWIDTIVPNHFSCIRNLVLAEWDDMTGRLGGFRVKISLTADGQHESDVSGRPVHDGVHVELCKSRVEKLVAEIARRPEPDRMRVDDIQSVLDVVQRSSFRPR